MRNHEYKKKKMLEMLKKLHDNVDVEEVRNEFKSMLKSISPLEIPVLEQELVKEGMSPKDIVKMCNIHVEIFRESVEGSGKKEIAGLPHGHPLETLYMENDEIIKDSEMLNLYATSAGDVKSEKRRYELLEIVDDILSRLTKLGPTHYSREEMLIFPSIERRGISAVPTVLWTKHDEVRNKIKYLNEFFKKNYKEDNKVGSEFLTTLKKEAAELSRLLTDMVFRENNIFYPTAKALLSDQEWVAIMLQSEEYRYYKVKPEIWKTDAKPLFPHEIDGTMDAEKILSLPKEVQLIVKGDTIESDDYNLKRDGDINMITGFISPDEMIEIFKKLPVDITFIDKYDRVRFFSGGERVFQRSKNVLGRKVQLCHPPKSVHIVERILKEFKSGKRDIAEFYFHIGPKFIHIRYFPIFSNGDYIGTLEVSQDVTGIRNLKGEKRIIDIE